jgi:hypothetical protein
VDPVGPGGVPAAGDSTGVSLAVRLRRGRAAAGAPLDRRLRPNRAHRRAGLRGGDAGQLLGGDPTTGKAHYLQRDGDDAELETDDESGIAWFWQSAAKDAGPGRKLEWVFVGLEQDVRNGEAIRVRSVLDRTVSTIYHDVALATATAEQRTKAGIRGRLAAVKLGSPDGVPVESPNTPHTVAIGVHSVTVGYWER